MALDSHRRVTVVGELIDSVIFIIIAFTGILPNSLIVNFNNFQLSYLKQSRNIIYAD